MLNHQKLDCYQRSLQMLKALQEHMPRWSEAIPKDQIKRAMVSVLLNTAEGCGKLTPKDKARFFSIARGSLLEVSSCLDVLMALNQINPYQNQRYQEELLIITKMLSALIKKMRGGS